MKMTTFEEKILNAVTDISNASTNPFKDKWVSILGDSISTYKGFNPEGQDYTEQPDLKTVKDTWWGYLLDKLGAKLCVNNSQNGITCCGGQGVVSKDRHKMLHREADKSYRNLDDSITTEKERIDPDIILVFLGHNDYNCHDKAFGKVDLREPKAIDFKDITNVCNGFESLMNGLTYAYPYATVYIMNPIYVGDSDKTQWPLSGNSFNDPTADGYWTQPELAENIRLLTVKYGLHYIATNQIGILPTTEHSGTDKFLYSGGSHPTAAGHRIIGHKVMSSMLNDYAGWAVRKLI